MFRHSKNRCGSRAAGRLFASKEGRFRTACFFVWLAATIQNSGLRGAESGQEKVEQREFAQLAAEAAARYDLRLAEKPDKPLVLHAEPILKWSNPEHGRVYGHVYLWTYRGRPEAIVSIYKWYHPLTHSSHEFQSLSLGGLKATRDGSEAWNARAPGMELKPLSEAPAPAATAAERLRQMRNAVRQFRAEATSREAEKSQLRLLPSPLYRYEKTEADLIDGALFAFVQATDPDVVLLIEARRGAAGSAEWLYGLARLNSIALRAFFHDREVWSAPELPWRQVQDRSQPYFSQRLE